MFIEKLSMKLPALKRFIKNKKKVKGKVLCCKLVRKLKNACIYVVILKSKQQFKVISTVPLHDGDNIVIVKRKKCLWELIEVN